MTAATAPATAPRTVVAADESADGFGADVLRIVREAAARAAVFFFAAVLVEAARFDRLFVGFGFAAVRPVRLLANLTVLAVLPERLDVLGFPDRFARVVRLATRPSSDPQMSDRDQKNERRSTPLANR